MSNSILILKDIMAEIAIERKRIKNVLHGRGYPYVQSRGLSAYVMKGSVCVSDDRNYNQWDGSLSALKKLQVICRATPGSMLYIECMFDGANSLTDYLNDFYEPMADGFEILVDFEPLFTYNGKDYISESEFDNNCQ